MKKDDVEDELRKALEGLNDKEPIEEEPIEKTKDEANPTKDDSKTE